MSIVSISGISKAKLLAGLYNHSKPLGMGILQLEKDNMREDQAQELIDKMRSQGQPLRFDYLDGRVMKVNITTDELETYGYDRDNGQGAVQKVIDKINANQSLDSTLSEKDIDAAANLAKTAGITLGTITKDGRTINESTIEPDQEIVDAVNNALKRLRNQ